MRFTRLVHRDALRAHPAQRHVGGADAVRAEDDLVERAAGAHPHGDGAVGGRRPPTPRPPDDARTVSGPSPRDASSTAASTQPAPRTAADVGGPGHVDLLDLEGRAPPQRIASAMPGVRTTRMTPSRRAAHRPRSADAWARGARRPPARTAPGPPARADRPGDGPRSPPRTPPCRRRRPRWPVVMPARHPARTTPRRSRRSRARPRSCAACGPIDRAAPRAAPPTARSAPPSCAAPGPSRRRARASVSVSPTTHSPPAARTATRASTGAASSAKPPRPSATWSPTCCAVRPSMAARSAAAARSRHRPMRRCAAGDGERRLPDGLPARAAAEVGEQGLVDRGRRRAAHAAPRPDSRTTMPGVQNPHWLAPAAVNAAAQRSASVQALDGRDLAAGHPPGRGHAGHPGLTVHQHGAAAALALRAAAVLGRAHVEPVPQRLQQRAAVVRHLHRPPVQDEAERSGHVADVTATPTT